VAGLVAGISPREPPAVAARGAMSKVGGRCGDLRGELARRFGVKGHTANFDTASEADTYRQERLGERRHGGTGDPSGGKLTVAQWWERWQATRQVSSSTRAREQSIWVCQIEPRFGSVRLADLRRSDIAAWTAGMSGELAPATVTRCLGR